MGEALNGSGWVGVALCDSGTRWLWCNFGVTNAHFGRKCPKSTGTSLNIFIWVSPISNGFDILISAILYHVDKKIKKKKVSLNFCYIKFC